MKNKLAVCAILWLVVVLGAGLYLKAREFGRQSIETDILALLPESGRSELLTAAVAQFSRQIGSRLIIVAEDTSFDVARTAALSVKSRLVASSVFSDVSLGVTEDFAQQLSALYFPHRFGLVGPTIRRMIAEPDATDALIARVEAILGAPLSGQLTANLKEDPLLVFIDFLQGLKPGKEMLSLREGVLAREVSEDGQSHWAVVVFANLSASAFQRDYQTQVVRALQETKLSVERDASTVRISSTGVVKFAEVAARTAEEEISLIGFVSLIGVVILVLLPFRSFVPLILTCLTIVVGCAVAFAVSLAAFTKVHMITVGFGASLIGVGVDHGFHFFCHQAHARGAKASPFEVLRSIFVAIFLGILTTILGFVGLLIAPMPGLMQIAVFSIAGLTAAFCTVVFWFPFLSRVPPARPGGPLIRASQWWLDLWRRRALSVRVLVGLILLTVVVGVSRVTVSDDVRLLDLGDPKLRVEDEHVRSIVSAAEGGKAFIVSGSTPEEMLIQERKLLEMLAPLRDRGAIEGFEGISKYIPPLVDQRSARKDLAGFATSHRTELTKALVDELGFEEQVIERAFDEFAVQADVATDSGLLTFDEWLSSPVSTPLRALSLGKLGNRYATLVTLEGVHDWSQLETLASGDSVLLLDEVGDASAVLHQQRVHATRMVPVFYGVVLVVLLYRFGLVRGGIAFVPAVIAAFACVATNGLLGNPMNLFSVLAIIIVLGIGIDYAIFLLEGEDEGEATMAAVVLSTASTLLSLALLALCTAPVLRAFGQNLFVGAGIAMLLAPLVLYGRESTDDSE